LNPPAGKQWRLAGVDPVATDGTPALERTTVRIEANRYGGEEYRIPLTVFLDRNEIAACQATTSSETEARASRLFNDRKFAGALPVFQELVQMGRSGAWAQRGVAESLSRLGRRKEAVQAYRRALELKPDDRDSLYWYANSLIGMDDKEAVVQFRKLITQEPGDARGEIGLANALYGLDRFPETVEALARARELCATCLNDNDRLIEADARRLSR
jgi:tetratricopeptide (TPR) repeat protein